MSEQFFSLDQNESPGTQTREEQLRIWLETKKKKTKKKNEKESTIGARRQNTVPQNIVSETARKASIDSQTTSVLEQKKYDKTGEGNQDSALDTDHGQQRDYFHRLYGQSTVASSMKSRNPSERKSLPTKSASVEKHTSAAMTRQRTPCSAGQNKTEKRRAITEPRVSRPPRMPVSVTERMQKRESRSSSFSTKVQARRLSWQTPRTGLTNVSGKLGEKQMELTLATPLEPLSPMTCSIKSISPIEEDDVFDTNSQKDLQEQFESSDDNENFRMENHSLKMPVALEKDDKQSTCVNFQSPLPLGDRSNTFPKKNEKGDGKRNGTCLEHSPIDTPTHVVNTPKMLSKDTTSPKEQEKSTVESEDLFDWRENLSPDFQSQKQPVKRRADESLLLLPTPSPIEGLEEIDCQQEEALIHTTEAFPGEAILNEKRTCIQSSIEVKENNNENSHAFVFDGSHVSTRRKKGRRESLCPKLSHSGKQSFQPDEDFGVEQIGCRESPCETTRQQTLPKYNEKTVLYPISECIDTSESDKQFHNICPSYHEEMQNQINLLLIEKRKLQDKIFSNTKDYEERVTPFRSVFDEVRPFQRFCSYTH
jgi:hypothetical protein